jgi:HK97 family phage portal protein
MNTSLYSHPLQTATDRRERRMLRAGFPMTDPKNAGPSLFQNWNRDSSSGIRVDASNATECSAVFCALQNLALISTLPWTPMQKLPDGKRRVATEHRLYKILRRSLNSDNMPPHRWWEWMINSAAARGNAYSYLEWKSGYLEGIWPLFTSEMKRVERKGNELMYVYQFENKEHFIPALNIWHMTGYFEGGILGLSHIDKGKEAIGKAMAQEKYAARFYGGDGVPTFYLYNPGGMPSPEQAAEMKRRWKDDHGGVDKSHLLAIASDGMEYRTLGVKPIEMEMIAAMKLSIGDVGRLFNMPQSRLGEQGAQPKANMEQDDAQFLKYCLEPWIFRGESSTNVQCYTQGEQEDGYYVRCNRNAFVRADLMTRTSVARSRIDMGMSTRDEERGFEDWDELPDDLGKEPFAQVNTMPLRRLINGDNNTSTAAPAPEPQPDAAPDANADEEDAK